MLSMQEITTIDPVNTVTDTPLRADYTSPIFPTTRSSAYPRSTGWYSITPNARRCRNG